MHLHNTPTPTHFVLNEVILIIRVFRVCLVIVWDVIVCVSLLEKESEGRGHGVAAQQFGRHVLRW